MGLFGSLFAKNPEPVAPNPIREVIFGDMPLDKWTGGTSCGLLPWSLFAHARAHLEAGNTAGAMENWRQVIAEPDLESRQYLQAWNFLRQHGQQPPPEAAKQVLGTVAEVGMPKGCDIVVAYADRHARYFNYSGAAVIWEHPDTSLDAEIDALLEVSAQVVKQIGPWDKERLPAPTDGMARISFLTPSGLHFGQGPMGVLGNDPLGGMVLNIASALMRALMAKGSAARKEKSR